MSAEGHVPAPPGDFVLPFDLPVAGVRGRLVRLDASSARAMSAHALPEAASRVLGETLALSAILGTALKLDGRLSVQTKSNGPLDLVAADYYGTDGTKPKGVRGFARLKEGAKESVFPAMVGAGSLAITIEPRTGGQTYQGITALSPDGIAASAEAYFAQSEQLPTALRLAAGPLYEAGRSGPGWRAAGIMLQATPGAKGSDDDWERLAMHLRTTEDLELLDTSLAGEALLWRLFNEDEVRVLPAEAIAFRCDCDGARIAAVLRSYSAHDRASLADPDRIIRARCEFCGAVHEIEADAL
ncbi:MAG TPA: Hsp33 family molecular chaperone HslO [Rhizomicrobium sp.]|nr:Hsp33 family molecular chaperone HslO [Rhizomicrobium sp.]